MQKRGVEWRFFVINFGGGIDYRVSLIRFVAFLMIIICHIFQYLEYELAWWFNVGVQIFLYISGYLYGQKNIKDDIEFYKKQIWKILLPYYIVIIPICLLYKLLKITDISWHMVVRVLLCNATVSGGGHLWFIATILMCYFLCPFYLRYLNCRKRCGKVVYLGLVLYMLIMNEMLFTVFFKYFKGAWINCFFLGVCGGHNKTNKIINSSILNITVVSLTLFNLIQIYIDYVKKVDLSHTNLKILYDKFCDYNHVFLGISIFYLLYFLFGKLDYENKILQILCESSDKLSYECYLVHQFFILGPLSLMKLTPFVKVNIVIIFFCIFFTGCIVSILKNYIFRLSCAKRGIV